MKNIDYLELFFKKHNLSGKVKVRFSSPTAADDCMSEIELENGDIININDIVFDIESEFHNDIAERWLVDKKTNDISLVEWVQQNTNYVPNDIDTSTVKEYQNEVEELFNDVKNTINTVFEFVPDDEGDSDADEESGDE